MSASLLSLVSGLTIVALEILIVWRNWSFPLKHGPGYFAGAAVAEGFYESGGRRWLTGYRTLLIVRWLLLAGVVTVVIGSGDWSRMPVIAPVAVVSFLAVQLGYPLLTRYAVGSGRTALQKAALPLKRRRLGEYLSWRSEVLMLTVITASWVLLLTLGGPAVSLACPVITTYIALARLPGQIIVARSGCALPPEQTSEYEHWMEVRKRSSLRFMSAMAWFNALTLASYAVRQSWPAEPWVLWMAVAAIVVSFAVMMVIVFRGLHRMEEAGRGLKPLESFSWPFRRVGLSGRGSVVWAVCYCLGLAVLLVVFRG